MRKSGWALALLLFSGIAVAAPRYITSDLQVDMRSGPTNNYRITKFLSAGERVETLETNDEGWTRVRTRAGEEGWVLSRYLENNPGPAEQLQRTTAALNKLREDTQAARQRLSEETARAQAAEKRIAELEAANDKMKQQLAEAGRGLSLAQENKALKEGQADAQRKINELNAQVERLRDRSARDWFVTGAAVVFAGFFVGILVTRIRWRRKSSWSSL